MLANSTNGSLPHLNDSISPLVGNVALPVKAPLSPSTLAMVFLAYTLAFVLTVVGNVVAIVVLTCGRRSRTDVRIFLLNLAIADLIMGVVCLPVSSMAATIGWLLPEFMCPLVMFLQHTSVATSVYINSALSVDRFLAVKYPFKRLTISKSYIPVIIVVVWLAAAGMSAVQLFVSRVVQRTEYGTDELECREEWADQGFTKYYSVIVLTTTFIVPACLFIVMYGLVCHELWKRNLPGLYDQGREHRHLRAKRKVVQMLIIMAALFIASWLPLHLLFILRDFYPDDLEHLKTENQMAVYYYFAHLLAISNSFQNPIIYGFLNDNFRCDLAELLIKCCPFFECVSAIKKAASARMSSVSLISAARRQSSALRLRFMHELAGGVYQDSPTRTCRRTFSDESCRPIACSPEPPEPDQAMQSMASWSAAIGVSCCVNGIEVVSDPVPPTCTDLELALTSAVTTAIVAGCPVVEGKLCHSRLVSSCKGDDCNDLTPVDDGSESTSFIPPREQ